MNKIVSRNGERLSWDDHHMMLALLTSQRSPDPNTQVGACIVKDNVIVGLGYNGLPRGMNHCSVNWSRDNKDPLETKYPFIVHAEKNAISNASTDIVGATLYATMFPCNECAKDIIQSGIRHLVYLEDPYNDMWQARASRWMLTHLDISIKQHQWSMPRVDLCLTKLSEKITSKT